MTINKKTSPIEAFVEARLQPPDEIIEDGELHRFRSEPGNRDKNGWYIYIKGPEDRMHFGCNKIYGVDKTLHWFAGGKPRKLTDDEKKYQNDAKRRNEEATRIKRFEVAKLAERIYASAELSGSHGYLTRKGIQKPEFARFHFNKPLSFFGFNSEAVVNALVTPIYNAAGILCSLQIITEQLPPGKCKLFMKGAQSKATWVSWGDWATASKVIIGEGIATCQSIFEATGSVIVCAYDSGDLPTIYSMIRLKNPSAIIVIAVDHDDSGRKAANKCVGALRVDPPDPEPDKTDWNDMHQKYGLEVVKEAFDNINQKPAEEYFDPNWKTELIVKENKNGDEIVQALVYNMLLILRNGGDFRGKISFNELMQSPCISGEDITDEIPVIYKSIIEKKYIHFAMSTNEIRSAIGVVAKENSFHPIRDYLKSLKWDGKSRVSGLFSEYFSTKDTDYEMAVSKSFLVSAVARTMSPGCQVDTMVVLEGGQGIRKSTSLRVLFFKKWHAEISARIGDKDFFQNFRGKWCMEFGEMAGMKKADEAHIKNMLTVTVDNYRSAYARMNMDFPRQHIFAATTNETKYLNDHTGRRRYLPVYCAGEIDVVALERDRDQLWAEAFQMYLNGDTWWEIPNAEEEQAERITEDTWQEKIEHWLDHPDLIHDSLPPIKFCTSTEIQELALDLSADKQTKANQMRVLGIMSNLKWEKIRSTENGVRAHRYYRPEKS